MIKDVTEEEAQQNMKQKVVGVLKRLKKLWYLKNEEPSIKPTTTT